jgi:hypothetical protein
LKKLLFEDCLLNFDFIVRAVALFGLTCSKAQGLAKREHFKKRVEANEMQIAILNPRSHCGCAYFSAEAE